MSENIACYVRVSTEDQNLERQLQSTHEYAQDEFGVGLDAIETFRDKSTGTDVARDGYQTMMAQVEFGGLEAVVVKKIARICRSQQDLLRTVERFRENDVELHFVDDPITVKSEQDAQSKFMMNILGAVAEFEAEMIQERVRSGIAARQNDPDYHHGPAPLGFEKDNGRLIEQQEGEPDDYHRVCTVLEDVAKGEMSKRKAAEELDTARSTIRRSIEERGELYGL